MSMLSTFYLGGRGEVLSVLAGEHLLEARTESVDFSGGIQTPLLIADDFDALFQSASNGKLQSFSQVWSELIFGEPDTAAEYQAHVLAPFGAELLARLTDDQIHEFSRNWNAERDKEREQQRPITKHRRIEDRIRAAAAFWALPIALVIGIPLAEHGTLPQSKILFPSLVVALALLARRYLRRRFGAFTTTAPAPSVDVDWFPILAELRSLCCKAREKGKDVVYFWSL